MFKDKKIGNLLLIMILVMFFWAVIAGSMGMDNNTLATPIDNALSGIVDFQEDGIPQATHESFDSIAVNWGNSLQASTTQP